MKQAGSFFEFKLELAIRMYFLCVDFFGRLPGGCAILTVDSLAKDQSTVSFRVNPATKKQPNACYYGDHQRKSASSGW